MRGMGETPEEGCPFTFNMDPDTFKPGDLVSYRVPDSFGDTPFVGELIEVNKDHVILRHYGETGEENKMKGTREARPAVSSLDALGED